jgi:hypothetical protein
MKIIVTTFLLFPFLSCCAFGQDKAAIAAAEAACGPDNIEFSVATDESKHPTPAPENGKAMIYVVQRAGGAYKFKFGADGKWLGALKDGTYFYATVDPGEHHLCVKGHLPLWKGMSWHRLTAKQGETYYFFVRVLAGGGRDELTLVEVDPDQGKGLVAWSKFISSQAK